ncbi:MAG: hypothetical protein ACUVXI_05785 [bacterium]
MMEERFKDRLLNKASIIKQPPDAKAVGLKGISSLGCNLAPGGGFALSARSFQGEQKEIIQCLDYSLKLH